MIGYKADAIKLYPLESKLIRLFRDLDAAERIRLVDKLEKKQKKGNGKADRKIV